jgi:hypothetical protein
MGKAAVEEEAKLPWACMFLSVSNLISTDGQGCLMRFTAAVAETAGRFSWP